ncbi:MULTISPECIES: Tat pathway signal protein [Burkholderia]|uniref:Tat pathway signal protein n=1 Tax=Burkholderia contaminans TaxID=488447 RepID=A0A2S5E8H8_9BURK|nr:MULTISPECIES: Tat pathway signal protein [Burkholderia]EKS9795560.1 Tat pathway signal protein [Burkholderia cepacia]EKS9801863.1 Tat pathway signal protein [Burkholderia cepacia]EKS9811968.1 Tat pathway signal protein [Burkholderia cepacia]EKS9817072.1 Tat pathway signal protein [Burkholderia cepacia]EKS9827830.1 Tat pathway signal protein [Burkholderia cepacia]
MQTRRHFLASVSASALAATGAASAPAFANDAPVSDAELQRQMLGKLTNELNDRTAAADETGYLFDPFFSWLPPTVPNTTINTIAAFSFGSRAAAAPGPVNEAIADAVFLLHQKVAVRIFAQQEVASVLASKYGLTAGVTSIATPAAAAGSPIPTPDGIAAAIVKQAGSAAALGNVGVVTHADQASLVVRVSNAAGMQAAVPAGLTLPSLYDASAQMPALRRRDLYLLSNVGVQLGMLRLDLINREYPNG